MFWHMSTKNKRVGGELAGDTIKELFCTNLNIEINIKEALEDQRQRLESI